MKFLLSFFLAAFLFQTAFSQKNVSHVYDAGNIEQLVFYADEIFRINIKTSLKDEIVITTHSSGEYFNDIHLKVERLEKKMIISTSFPESLQEGFDKLSAHKVFSVEVTLEIPEDLDVYVESNIASLTGAGEFDNLQVQLRSGYCKLENFSGNALVNTYSGSIEVQTSNAVIDAYTRSGKISLPPKSSGRYVVKLHSGTGDILVREN